MEIDSKHKIFAIGDIHGCYNELMALMAKLPIEPRDTVVFLGDYVDRGPDSRLVVEQLIEWKAKFPHWRFLRGNHEDMFTDYLSSGQRYDMGIFEMNGGDVTLESYAGRVPRVHRNFLQELEEIVESPDYVFVHAGLVPGIGLPRNRMLITRPNIHPHHLWARDDFINNLHDWGKTIIFGHTPNYAKMGQPIRKRNKIGIDGAIAPPSNKSLIAVELPSEKFYFQESLTRSR